MTITSDFRIGALIWRYVALHREMALTDSEMYKVLQACAARLRENPDDPDALFYTGAIYARIGKIRASMLYLNRLSAVDENYPGIWKLKAGILKKLGDEEMSAECLRKAEFCY